MGLIEFDIGGITHRPRDSLDQLRCSVIVFEVRW
jgi:hypothetical protein